jgi:hypothetical protein
MATDAQGADGTGSTSAGRVEPPAPPAAGSPSREEMKRTASQAAATAVAAICNRAQHEANERLRELSDWWKTQVEAMKSDWLKETGEPMPMKIDQLVESAVEVTGQPRASDTVGDSTLADLFAWQRGSHRQVVKQAELTAAAVARQMIQARHEARPEAGCDSNDGGSKRSTKKKRHEITAKVGELITRLAKARRVEPHVIIAEVATMSHVELARALQDECHYDTSSKNVSRWRKDAANLEAKFRSIRSGGQEDDAGQRDAKFSLEEAMQSGLSRRTRIGGITRLGAERLR